MMASSYNNQPTFPKEEITMETNNIQKQYILIYFYNSEKIILMQTDFAMDYIITHSHEIESMEYIDLVIPKI